MMIRSIVVLVTLSMCTTVFGCDVCSVTGTGDMLLRRNRISYTFRFRELRTETASLAKSMAGAKHLDHFVDRGEIRELYFAHEVRATMLVGERMNVTIGLPIVSNYRSVDGFTSAEMTGVGDPWFLIQRDMLPDSDLETGWRWTLGIGAKLPLGDTDREVNGETPDLDIQPGTGSTDLLFQAGVIKRGVDWVIRSDNTLKLNGSGEDDYRYGHGMITENVIGRVIAGETLMGMVYAGPYLEWTGRDVDHGRTMDTRMSLLFGELGGSLQYKEFAIDLRYQYNVWHSESNSQIPTTQRLNTSLLWIF